MRKQSYIFLSLGLFSLFGIHADEGMSQNTGDSVDNHEVSAVESVATQEPVAPIISIQPPAPVHKAIIQEHAVSPFTGKIKGKKVRMRVGADLDSKVVRELSRDDLVVIIGEKGDFYAIEPPADVKAYVFRSFVLDGIVEANRVNVRLEPSIDAPIISHLNSGDHIKGVISSLNSKWYEIAPPSDTRFYVAKEYIDNIGGPDMKIHLDRKKAAAQQVITTADALAKTEMQKSYHEMDIASIRQSYETVISEYGEFPELVSKAKEQLAQLNESYLEKKIAFLEDNSANHHDKAIAKHGSSLNLSQSLSATDRMKVWAPLEEARYLSWASINDSRPVSDFYEEELHQATTITGIIEAYSSPVKKKPGDFILRDKELPLAYLYSTHINLQEYVGKKVTLTVSSRDNNNFAFPAYYVLSVE